MYGRSAHALEKNLEQQVLNGKTAASYTLACTCKLAGVSGIIKQYLVKKCTKSLYLNLKTENKYHVCFKK